MQNLGSEVIHHMLEVSDAQKYSALFKQPHQWDYFNEWCDDSPEAIRIITKASEEVETFCVDNNAQLYCIAMSMETLETIVKTLVEAYEDEELDRFFS